MLTVFCNVFADSSSSPTLLGCCAGRWWCACCALLWPAFQLLLIDFAVTTSTARAFVSPFKRLRCFVLTNKYFRNTPSQRHYVPQQREFGSGANQNDEESCADGHNSVHIERNQFFQFSVFSFKSN